ncbi:WASH complex subunit 2-like isoform X2 [Euwallacea fornicatus]|uniref:WASH complex subunit 2-like isoform X2 n=1 Tax=Euwallacea fornicatus TaxID=995702 RepID=UPI00338FE2E2
MSEDTDEWSTEQVIASAGNWSLAGDVAILNRLKNFSQGLLLEINLLNTKVDNLANNLELVGLKVDITKNEFHGLRNLKFIENRVYEDDETTEIESDKVPSKEPTEELKQNVLKHAILNGFKVVDKYYDKIEVDVSDSEGESNEKGYVLQPKDPYMDRPLPYLVGSDNWVKKQHIGLLISDESESEPDQEDVYSSSDSETYLPKNKALDSETSSELDFTSRTSDPIASSSLSNAEGFKRDDLYSYNDGSETSTSVSNKVPISKEQFAEQLASKLGDVITSKQTNEDTTSDSQSKPRQKLSNYESLFSDQPPPLEDLNKSILPKPVQQSLFGDDSDLFSENDSLLWGTTSKPTQKFSDDQKSSDVTPSFSKKVKVSKGLFSDSRSSSEEDMLAVTERRKLQSSAVHTNPYLPPSKSTIPFLADQPPGISPKKETQPNRRIPIGGVSIFGENTDIFGEKPVKFQSPLKEDELSTKTENSENFKSQNVIPKQSIKKVSLFDDSSDSSETEDVKPVKPELQVKGKLSPKPEKGKNIVSQSKTSQKTTIRKTNLFDDFSDASENDYITSAKPELPSADKLPPKTESIKTIEPQSGILKNSIKKISLFDDSSDSSDTDEIFSSKKDSLKYKSTENSSKGHSGIFEGLDDDFTPQENTDFKPCSIQKGSHPVVKKISLFDDHDEEDDDILKEEKDLFSGLSKKEVDAEHEIKSEKIDDLETPNHFDDLNQKPKEPKNDNTEKCLKDSEKFLVQPVEEHVSTGLVEPKNDDLFAEERNIGASQTGLSNEQTLKDVKHDSADVGTLSFEQQRDVINQVDFIDEGESEINIQGISDSTAYKGDSSPPAINLFDPTPPPVDWAALSDDSAESDRLSWTEGIFDQVVTNSSQLKSNIFDEAPPSLLGNQIEKTSSTRLDTDLSFAHDSSLTSPLSPDSSFDLPSSYDPFPEKVESGGIPHIESLDEISVNANVENKIISAGGDTEEKKGGSAFTKTVVPGKLKHNLNINVKALLPGKTVFNSRPVTGTSNSLDQLDESPVLSPTRDVTTSAPNRLSSMAKPKQEKISTKKGLGNSSFDELGGTQILHSITKDRARVPIKRRPSRRARHEAANTATISKEVPAWSISKTSSPNEESDLFTNENLGNRSVEETAKLKDRIMTEKNIELSAAKDEEKDTIFDKKNQVEPQVPKRETVASVEKPAPSEKQTSSRLFSDKSDDSDSDAGLFSSSKPKLPKTDCTKTSLFDSSGESSEEDLFGSKTSKNTSSIRKELVSDAKVEKKTREIKTANIKKLENKQVTDFDPLSGFK